MRDRTPYGLQFLVHVAQHRVWRADTTHVTHTDSELGVLCSAQTPLPSAAAVEHVLGSELAMMLASGATHSECADALGGSIGTIGRRVSAARRLQSS